MEGKVKKAIGIALLVCVALTGIAASPAAAADFTFLVFDYEYNLAGFDDGITQTCYPASSIDQWAFDYDSTLGTCVNLG
ncbi:MAG: hypothetical protein EHM20_01570 [Alphaproteobacteria bacterium]|nr:MAG: hypothetical protein EHM20_01570 [Alphaproteobacteria bacterium]